MNGRKVENCSRIKVGNGRLSVREDEVCRIILRICIMWVLKN